jgi:hypothetical protein
MSPRAPTRDERGAALLMVLLLTMLLLAVGASLVTVTTTETLVAASHRFALETWHGAEAALERAACDLAVMPDWSAALAPAPANVVSGFDDGIVEARGPDGRVLRLSDLTAERQRDSDARDGPAVFGADSPQWRLFAHAPLASLAPDPTARVPAYLVVWVADDGRDGDGNPAIDLNQTVLVHAEAFGGRGARRAVQAAIGRTSDGRVLLRAWHRVK